MPSFIVCFVFKCTLVYLFLFCFTIENMCMIFAINSIGLSFYTFKSILELCGRNPLLKQYAFNPIPCSGFDVVVILKPIFYCLFGKFDLNRLSTVETWSLRGLVMSVFNLVVFSTRVSSPTHNIVRIWWYQNDSSLITLNILPCYLQIMTSSFVASRKQLFDCKEHLQTDYIITHTEVEPRSHFLFSWISKCKKYAWKDSQWE